MPNYRDCKNCLGIKEADRLSEYYCRACQQASDEAADHALRESEDIGEARRSALGRLAPGSMSRKHPGMFFNRISTTDIEDRFKRGD